MRRIIPLIMILFILSACSAQQATVTDVPTPTPSSDVSSPVHTPKLIWHTPAPTPTPHPTPSWLKRPSEIPDYIPPMDFEPVSVWRAEPFGDNGDALLYLGAEINGVIPFKVFICGDYDIGTTIGYGLHAFSYSAESKVPGGDFIVLDGMRAYAEWIIGNIKISDDKLSLSYYETGQPYEYLEMAFDNCKPRIIIHSSGQEDKILWLPTTFTKLPDNQITKAMYSLPLFTEEIIYYPNKGDTAFLYDSQYTSSYITQDPQYAASVRNLKIGDTYADIVFRFPNYVIPMDPTVLNPSKEYRYLLYGGFEWYYNGYLTYIDGAPAYVRICAVEGVTFYLDESLTITSIGYSGLW